MVFFDRGQGQVCGLRYHDIQTSGNDTGRTVWKRCLTAVYLASVVHLRNQSAPPVQRPVSTVPDPGKRVSADTVNRGAILEGGGTGSPRRGQRA